MTRIFRSLVIALVVVSLSAPVVLAGPVSREEARESTLVASFVGTVWDALMSRWEDRAETARECSACTAERQGKRFDRNSTDPNSNSNSGGNGNEQGSGMDPNG
ncbi:MAG: hypothetical protein AAF604_03250 [Acidobacteriota bacterium]